MSEGGTTSEPAHLRIGFVPVIRPLFKGDAPAAAQRSRERLEQVGAEHAFHVVVAAVGSDTVHDATGNTVPSYAVTDAAEAVRAAHELADADLDLLLIQHVSFATGDLLEPLLNAHPRVAVWALPEAAGDRGATGPLPLNALCGLNMTLSLLDAPEVAKEEHVGWLYGDAEDDWFRARFLALLGAMRGLAALDGARVLQIGGTAPAFWGIQELPNALHGVTVDTRPLEALYDAVAAVPEHDAAALARDWARERHDVDAASLERGARIELGLTRVADEAGAHALAVRCWPELPDACGSMACAAMGNVAGSGIPTACEGDVMGAVSMLALQGVTGVPAVLMDLSDLDRADDSLQVWHCGNAPLRWAADAAPVRLTTHFNRDGVGVVRDMVLRPGPTTGLRLLDGGRRAWLLEGRLADPEKPGFDGVRAWLRDLRWNGAARRATDVVAGVLDARLPHHLALGRGDAGDAVRELCRWLDADPLPAPDPVATGAP